MAVGRGAGSSERPSSIGCCATGGIRPRLCPGGAGRIKTAHPSEGVRCGCPVRLVHTEVMPDQTTKRASTHKHHLLSVFKIFRFLLKDDEEVENKLVVFMSIDNVKFRKAVVPGDQLVMELTMLKARRNTFKMGGKAFVKGELVAEAEMMAGIVDR